MTAGDQGHRVQGPDCSHRGVGDLPDAVGHLVRKGSGKDLSVGGALTGLHGGVLHVQGLLGQLR
jgi:hypothetical protein